MRKVCVAGVGSTAFGRHRDRSLIQLAGEAAQAAIADAGVERRRIGAVYLGNFVAGALTGQEVLAGLLTDQLALGNIPATKVEGACASGGIAFRHACIAVATGQCEVALAVGAEKMAHASSGRVAHALNAALDTASDGQGLTFPGLYGLAWRLHAERYGTTRRQVSAVIIKNKANGLKNPLAQMGATLDEETIRQSKPIADPLLLYDCCPISDGAAAAIVTSLDRAAEAAALPIEVRATVQTSGSARIAGHGDLSSFDASVSAARLAYEQAGIGPEDLDLVELHDCFSIAEVIDAEDLGLMPRGQGAAWAAEGRTAVGGSIAVNPSGGLLAKGHPVGATGVGQIYEAVLQLRGDHPNQVKDAALALSHNLGGTGVACSVTILGRPDA